MRSEHGVSVALAVVDGSGRRIDHGPEEVSFGAVRLSPWQVHRVAGATRTFPGAAVHLVKINYDLCADPGAPALRWFEVGFALVGKESTVVAALPRGAAERQPAASYTVSGYLEFVPVEDRSAL